MKDHKKMSKAEMALDVFRPDAKGFSRKVTKEEMVGRYPELSHDNGWDWGRYDGKLAQKYNLKRYPETGAIEAYQLLGFRTDSIVKKSIRKDIRDAITSQPCAVTGVNPNGGKGRVECDHKNGRYDDPSVNEHYSQELEDFQPLHKNVNTIKREHCKRCEQTGRRFDARILGFSIPWLEGEERYTKHLGCTGCYWHDVRHFHASLKPSSFRYRT